jgi:WD40 repeat protein
VTALAIDRSGRRLVSGSEDGALIVWDLTTLAGEVVAAGGEPVAAVALSPDGRHAAVRASGSIVLWDLATRTCKRMEVQPDPVSAPAWLPPALTVSGDGRVYFGSPLRQWTPHTGALRSALDPKAQVLTVSSDDADVALVTPDGEALEVWDRIGDRARPRISLPAQLASISCTALTPDGKRALVGYADHLVKAWDVGIVPPLGIRRGGDPARAEVTRIDLCAGGRYAVTVRVSGQESVWDLVSGECWNHTAGHEDVLDEAKAQRAAERDLRGRWEALCEPDGGTTGNAAAGGVVAVHLSLTERWSIVAAHPDCAIALPARTVKTGEYVEPDHPDEHSGYWALRLCRLSPCAGAVERLVGHSLPAIAAAISADGRLAVSGGLGRTLRVWDLEAATQHCTLKGHRDTIRAVALARDVPLAASASDDRTVRVWDLARGELLATFTGELRMTTCAISPDGSAVIAGEGGGRVHVLRLERP